jgi:hypothetical protein
MKTYTVTVKHPTDFHKGEHAITVKMNRDGTRYCDGRGCGCSRDYNVKTDADAIRRFLAEHACDVICIK